MAEAKERRKKHNENVTHKKVRLVSEFGSLFSVNEIMFVFLFTVLAGRRADGMCVAYIHIYKMRTGQLQASFVQ